MKKLTYYAGIDGKRVKRSGVVLDTIKHGGLDFTIVKHARLCEIICNGVSIYNNPFLYKEDAINLIHRAGIEKIEDAVGTISAFPVQAVVKKDSIKRYKYYEIKGETATKRYATEFKEFEFDSSKLTEIIVKGLSRICYKGIILHTGGVEDFLQKTEKYGFRSENIENFVCDVLGKYKIS